MENEERISIANLKEGAAIERFDLALQEVLDNIQDPNTDAKKVRTVTLKLSLQPDDDRNVGKYTVSVISGLSPVKPFAGNLFMGRDRTGRGHATEAVSRQQDLFAEPKPQQHDGDKVYKLAGKE